MTKKTQQAPAKVGRGPKISTIWLVPFVGFVIGAWMVWFNWASQGPLIEITFVSGQGIEAGKTKVKRKNVEVGEVQSLRLSSDAEHVVLTVRMEKHAQDLLREDSSFWVVRPRVGKGGISGLGTILSGSYIELSPGTSEDTADEFEGLETPPVTPIGTPGLHVTLDSAGNRPLTEGDPILFHGLEVGRIEYVHFNGQERRTYYDAFIAAPYDRLITANTRFWFSSGISVNLSADGIRIEMASLESVIGGGVSFAVPEGQQPGERITERAFFRIYPSEDAIYQKQYEQALTFVILFEDSIRGLRPGAPVEYRGVKVGQVLRTDTNYSEIGNLLDPEARIPVMVAIEPGRLGFDDQPYVLPDVARQFDELIAGGLHAGLETGSFVTGRKYVELSYLPEFDSGEGDFAGHSVIPASPSQFGRLLANAAGALDSLNQLQLGDVVDSAKSALDSFADTAAELETILADPEFREIAQTMNEAFSSFRQLASDYSAGSATYEDLQNSLQSLDESLNELEPVLRNLRRRPNSLVFGGTDGEDIEPEGTSQ